MMINIKCSECGKELCILYNQMWQYKVSSVMTCNKNKYDKFPEDSILGGYSYQCSYTCNDHARLRSDSFEVRKLTKENFIKYAKRSEESMRNSGKIIRFPIDLSDCE